MRIKKDIVWRVAIVYLAVLVLAITIIGRIVQLQFAEKEKWVQKGDRISMKEITIRANRGNIYSANNRLLATSVPFYEIRMDVNSTAMDDQYFYKHVDALADSLANLFQDKPAARYRRDLINAKRNGSRYHLIKRKVQIDEVEKLRKFPIFKRGRYRGGLIINQENKRVLPHYNLASRTIGYLTEGIGGNVVGLEGAYDPYLQGSAGVRLVRKLSGGDWMPVDDENQVEPEDGKDIKTTIDVNLQDVAEHALLNQLKRVKAHHGTAVLMEVNSGAIKAIANLQRNEEGSYSEVYTYAVGESTEPGPPFKLPVLMAALEDGYIDLYDTIDAGDGRIEYYGVPLRDSRKGGYGKISVKQAFEYSSNVAVSKIITDHYRGNERDLVNRLYGMNLNENLGVKIKGEGKPVIKYPDEESWSGLTLPWMSIGYEVRLTPLQLLAFYNAVANNGELVRPRFVTAITDHGKVVKEFDKEVINPAISSINTIAKAQKMLEGVVQNGTAENLQDPDYKIAGKTGTSQIANEKYGYEQEGEVSYQASFVGYFPADEPKYSCIVVVNSPSRHVYYGNLAAGPVFKEIADKVYATKLVMHKNKILANMPDQVNIPYSKHGHRKQLVQVLDELHIPYNDEIVDSEWVVTFRKEDCIELKNRYIKKNIMPNIKGMGLKDALYILENLGLKVEVKGKGIVYHQSVEAGTRIEKGEKVVIQLS